MMSHVYTVGMRVRNTSTNSNVRPNAEGTVTAVEARGTPVVSWDAGTFGHAVIWSREYCEPVV